MEDYEKKYKGALKRANDIKSGKVKLDEGESVTDYIFPQLKESEDERIRKAIIIYLDWLDGRKDYAPRGEYSIRDMVDWLEKQGNNNMGISEAIKQELEDSLYKALEKETPESCNEFLEKQDEQNQLDYPYVPGWRENRPDNKPQINHSVLMLTTHGVVEGEWLGDEKKWRQYRWSSRVKDADVLYWLHLHDLESLEKEGKQKPNANIQQKDFAPKIKPKFKVGDWIINKFRGINYVLVK